MVQPEDPYNRELRWLVHLKEEERMLQDSAQKIRRAGGNGDSVEERSIKIRTFRLSVEQLLPPGYALLSGNPSVEAMLQDLKQPHMYVLYKILAQFVHGGHSATSLYRKRLGTMKEFGEYISPKGWHTPLNTGWKCLQIFGATVLTGLDPKTPPFLSEGQALMIDHELDELRRWVAEDKQKAM